MLKKALLIQKGENLVSMLTKYNDQQVNWVATTYDDFEYYWTNNEYEVYKKATENPEIKILHFKDGSLSIADIRRVEQYERGNSVWDHYETD